MQLYLGIDCSTSCTGFAVLNTNGDLLFKDYVYSKEEYQKQTSLGGAYTSLYNLFDSKLKEINEAFPECDFDIAIECNTVNKGSFLGGVDTTMKLSIAIGVVHSCCLKNLKVTNVYYSAASNWRAGILSCDPHTERNMLKIGIMNWAERMYNFKLPVFEKKSDGIKIDDNYDTRINDISDAIGLAYCCKNGLLSDRRTKKIEQHVVDNITHSLKNHFKFYREKVETWYKDWKKNKNKSNRDTLLGHIDSLEKYYNSMIQKMVNNSLHDKFIKKAKEIKDEVLKTI